MLLFGSETWSCREDLVRKMEVFHNQCVRQMCHVTKFMQYKKHIKTTTLNDRVGLPCIREMLAVRQLRWTGHVARMENNRAPRMLLTAFVQHKRPKGRPEQTFGHSLKKFLCLRAKMMDEDALNQTYDFQPDPDVDDLVPITGIELRDALLRTTKSVKKEH